MNRTLLLIIVDFLFLNLIALTRWEKAEPIRPQQPPVPALGANAATPDQDLVETMRQSLADEQSVRQDLAKQLANQAQAISQGQQSLASTQAEKTQLSSNLAEAERTTKELNEQIAAAKEESSLTRDQIAELQRELSEKSAEAERQRQSIASLEKDNASANSKIQGLTMAVVVGEAEKQHLQEQATTLQSQVQAERAERAKVEESTTQLSQGVGQLAQNSGELTKEIRENRPINANVLFNEFLANRVQTTFTATRKGLFGSVVRAKDTPTAFITDGTHIYAVLHVSDTTFSYTTPNYDWTKIGISFDKPGGYHTTAGTLEFLQADPRVLIVPVDTGQASALGVKVYPLAADPFKFPDAVLISGAKGYGEVGFKLDPSHPGYVRVDNHFFKRLFGDFSPSRGDLVFSHTGELLGIMVNNDYCVVLKDFTAAETITLGDNTGAEKTGALLDGLAARIQSEPPNLQ